MTIDGLAKAEIGRYKASTSERSKEVEDGLLIVCRKRIKANDHRIRFGRPIAGWIRARSVVAGVTALAYDREVRLNRSQEVTCASVVKKEPALADAPERSRA